MQIVSKTATTNPDSFVNDFLNSGSANIYPCGYCETPVTWKHPKAICCNQCDIWYHSNCLELCAGNSNIHQQSNMSWLCCKCNTQNIDSFTFHSYEFDLSNHFSVLSNSGYGDIESILSPDSVFSPKL